MQMCCLMLMTRNICPTTYSHHQSYAAAAEFEQNNINSDAQ